MVVTAKQGKFGMNIGGLLAFTTIDFPGKLSAVIFTQGCALRCPYCHNPDLQIKDAPTQTTWQNVLDLLSSRKGLLDGVVFSGGEPLLQNDLASCAKQIRDMGFAIGLHTSGVFPDKLSEVLPFVDWIGLDIKAPFEKYAKASGTQESFEMGKRAEQALDMILKQGIDLEVRTTTDPRVVTPDDILKLGKLLAEKGVKTFAIQEYRPLNNGILKEPSVEEIKAFYTDENLKNTLNGLFEHFILRTA